MTSKWPLPRPTGERYFRWRGGDVSRVEALSDMAFAFAMTLVVVSLDVPKSIPELVDSLARLPGFAACFALLVWLWYHNFIFHRRFGLEDWATIALTGIQLFLILAFVYPLKFLADQMFGGRAPGGSETERVLAMVFYSGAFSAIMAISTIQNIRALRLRDALELEPVEVEVTRYMIRGQVGSTIIGLISIALAAVVAPWASGMVYFLMGPLHFANGFISGNRIEKAGKRKLTVLISGP